MTTGDLTGRELGHYRVLERLAEGGMGVVYKARDSRLDRTVALKVIHPERAGDADRRMRFLREARAASALNHPNILTVYEIGTQDDLDYIAMEYVDGGTLADVLRAGPLPASNVISLAGQVAAALEAAHAATVVHRDLKPSNIMLADGKRVKIVDFGLAKVLDPAPPASTQVTEDLTAAGTLLGTFPYMSPEQVSGQRADTRSDFFSFGVILYEMLAGQRPFGGDSAAAVAAAILHEPPPPIPGVSPALVRVLERCLQKDPARRFQSVAELGAAIQACSGQPEAGGMPSVAVLPLADMSGAPEDRYLCEGLAEEIISALTRITGLRVIARTSSFLVGQMGLDVREAGQRLGVDTILEGSVRRSGRRVRVTVQLVDTRDGAHLWSERYDRELTDVLALEDEVAEAVASRLRGHLAGEKPSAKRQQVDPACYEAYLEGRYYFARATPEALARAAASYGRAIELDRAFAQAYDALAELHWYLGFFGGVPPREAFAQSTWYAMRALELDDDLADTHALLGMLRKELDYNWPEVDRELARAHELNPESPAVRLRYAISGLMPHGRAEEALVEIDAALRSDPLSIFVRWTRGYMLYFARRAAETVDEGRHMIELDPGHFLGHWVLGLGHELAGDLPAAVAAMEEANRLAGGIPFTLGFLAMYCGRAGRGDEARAILDGLAKAAASRYVPPTAAAFGHLGLDERNEVFRRLEDAVDQRDPLVMPIKCYPVFDPIRDDPRYLALLEKMNLA